MTIQCCEWAHKITIPMQVQEYRTCMGFDIQGQGLLLGDNYPWVSYMSAYLLIRILGVFVPDSLLKDVCIAKNFGRWRKCLPPRQRTELFAVLPVQMVGSLKYWGFHTVC